MHPRAKPPKHAIGDETRQALIDAATDVFIDAGFRAARVQDIVAAAGVRLSAINYHFGSKEGLYFAVLQYHAETVIRTTLLIPPDPALPVEERFRFFIHGFVSRVLDPESPSRIARLLVREASNPTSALDMLFERFIRPQYGVLDDILHELFGVDTPPDSIARIAIGIVGQVIIYAALRPLITKFRPTFYGDPDKLTELAEHIADFSWAGLQALVANHRSEP
jgi:AcrR family transcriptional regulator